MLQALLVLIAIIAAIILVRGRLGDPYAPSAGNQVIEADDLWDHVEHPYHCVACKCSLGNCPGVASMKGKVFLVGDDHKLPVPECTASRCRCRYVHYPDRRRKQDDRRAAFGLEQEMYKYTHDRDRRISLGRRVEDWSVDLEATLG